MEEFWIESTNKQTKLHAVKWVPEGKIKAVLVIIHGMCEHIARYDEFAKCMADAGILVTGIDLLGHGYTAETEKELGYFRGKDPATIVVRDIHKLLKETVKSHRNLPVFILGHSMGSYIARNYIARYKSALSGVILTGGNDSPSIQGHFGRFMTTVLALFFGWHHRSNLCTMVTFGSYLKKIQDPISTSDWICRRKEVVRRYDEDPLCGFTFTLNGYHTLATFVERSSRESYYKNISKNIPMLIMSGDEDPVGEYVKGVTRMYERYKKYDNDVTFIIRHGDRHEILNENDREEVYEEIRKFIYKKGNLE